MWSTLRERMYQTPGIATRGMPRRMDVTFVHMKNSHDSVRENGHGGHRLAWVPCVAQESHSLPRVLSNIYDHDVLQT
eukprot:m.211065 g.211065  ORF g.211065 m.211065 type:complete len:77 (-) comp25359_c0_seq1:255-485(-)